MGLIIAPILEGQRASWENWMNELNTSKRSEFEDMNTRYGLTRHDAWHATLPMGEFSCVLHEGPGAASFMPELASSDHPFDVWFKNAVLTLHGMDVTQPPPGPMPQLVVSAQSVMPS